jgi:hypothetical protein
VTEFKTHDSEAAGYWGLKEKGKVQQHVTPSQDHQEKLKFDMCGFFAFLQNAAKIAIHSKSRDIQL